MSIQSIAEVLLALVVVGLLIYRQLRWRDFDPARVFRLPIVLGAIGLISLANLKGATITEVDAGLLVVELLLSVGIGALMGRLAVFRPDPSGNGMLQTRTGWAGASLWIALIAVRIAFDAVGASMGAHLLTQTGVILVLVAVSRATAAFVTRAREPRRALESA
jgi:hypothetical protein